MLCRTQKRPLVGGMVSTTKRCCDFFSTKKSHELFQQQPSFL